MQINPQIPEHLHFELKVQSVKMRMQMKDIVVQLLKKWIKGEIQPADVDYTIDLKPVHVHLEQWIIDEIEKSGLVRQRLIAGLIKTWIET